mmetsp:Transcript_77168/g.208343  ORF Transcript_77168/g.208343 Transcript_77168/m.208343 type:complete len:243 (-) Transcript_77168:54-782(-)
MLHNVVRLAVALKHRSVLSIPGLDTPRQPRAHNEESTHGLVEHQARRQGNSTTLGEARDNDALGVDAGLDLLVHKVDEVGGALQDAVVVLARVLGIQREDVEPGGHLHTSVERHGQVGRGGEEELDVGHVEGVGDRGPPVAGVPEPVEQDDGGGVLSRCGSLNNRSVFSLPSTEKSCLGKLWPFQIFIRPSRHSHLSSQELVRVPARAGREKGSVAHGRSEPGTDLSPHTRALQACSVLEDV